MVNEEYALRIPNQGCCASSLKLPLKEQCSDLSDPQLCRICMDEEKGGRLVAPCRCSGSVKYVHEECLKTWCESTVNKGMIIPGYLGQYDLKCEICHTPFRYRYVHQITEDKLWVEMAKHFLVLTIVLLVLYLIFGEILKAAHAPDLFYKTKSGGFWESYLNGFILVHLVLTIIYILLALFFSTSHGTCIWCCYVPAPRDNDCKCHPILIIILIIIGMIVTVLLVYFDVLGKVKERHKKKQRMITEFIDYEEWAKPIPNRNGVSVPQPSAPPMEGEE